MPNQVSLAGPHSACPTNLGTPPLGNVPGCVLPALGDNWGLQGQPSQLRVKFEEYCLANPSAPEAKIFDL
jgi:hypothetical protein